MREKHSTRPDGVSTGSACNPVQIGSVTQQNGEGHAQDRAQFGYHRNRRRDNA
jgi:hypothetical protein